MAGLWKADLHLHMAFPEIGQKIDLPVGAAADQGLGDVGAHIAILENPDQKGFRSFRGGIYRRIDGCGKIKVKTAGLKNDLIEMAHPGSLAPLMNPGKIDLLFIAFQIKDEIAEETDAEAAVEIVLQHMVDLIKCIFCGRENGVGIAADGLMAVTGAVGRKNFIYKQEYLGL